MPSRPATFRPTGYKPAPRKPKQVNPHYLTPEHRAWAAKVIERAGGRCEWVENGRRCNRSQPQHRMHADHVVELADGGDPFGPGQCLCTQHNTLKGYMARQRRQSPQAWDAMHSGSKA